MNDLGCEGSRVRVCLCVLPCRVCPQASASCSILSADEKKTRHDKTLFLHSTILLKGQVAFIDQTLSSLFLCCLAPRVTLGCAFKTSAAGCTQHRITGAGKTKQISFHNKLTNKPGLCCCSHIHTDAHTEAHRHTDARTHTAVLNRC